MLSHPVFPSRVFLHYVQKALYLSALSIALVTFGGGSAKIVGMMLAAVSLLLIVYSFQVFLRRSEKLNRRRTRAPQDDRERLDSKWGPVVIFAVVTATIIAAIGANLFFHRINLSRTPSIPYQRHKRRHSSLPVDLIAAITTSRRDYLLPIEIIRFIGLHGIINVAWGAS